MELLTIDIEDLREALGPLVWEEVKDRILEIGSIEKSINLEAANMFSKHYMLFRRREKHKGIKLVKKGDRSWKMVVDIARFIEEVFCVENSIPYKKGVEDFLKYGWEMGAVSLRDFLYKSEAINKEGELREEIENDRNKVYTKKLMDLYYDEGITRVGTIKFRLTASKHKVFFVRIAEELVDRKIVAKTFVQEFYEEWSWIGGWPQPKLLMSEYTLDLIQRISKNLNIEQPEVKGIYVKVMKKHGDGNSHNQ